MTKEEYKALLIHTSATGGFPARGGLFNRCMYRTDDGKKCAAGLLIPDECYTPQIEGLCINSFCDEIRNPATVLVARHLPEGVTLFQVHELQQAHDSRSQAWDHERFVADVNRILT